MLIGRFYPKITKSHINNIPFHSFFSAIYIDYIYSTFIYHPNWCPDIWNVVQLTIEAGTKEHIHNAKGTIGILQMLKFVCAYCLSKPYSPFCVLLQWPQKSNKSWCIQRGTARGGNVTVWASCQFLDWHDINQSRVKHGFWPDSQILHKDEIWTDVELLFASYDWLGRDEQNMGGFWSSWCYFTSW